jgi:hypothetical protein
VTTAAVEITLVRPVLHDAQQAVIDGRKRFNVLQCGRRFGKTTLGVDLAIDAALDGLPVGWFAPTYKILADAWRELVAGTRDVTAHLDQQERRIQLITGGVIECWSLDTPDPARGRKYGRVLIDEGGIVRDLEQAWNGAIRPTLTDLRGDAWFFGTPKGRNYFHQLYTRGQAGDGEWASWRFGTVANPAIEPAEVEAAERDMPRAAFEQEFLGIPADDGGNPFGIDAIRACIGPLSTAAPAVWGIDLAKSEDWTWALGLDGSGAVCRSERWQGPWSATLERLAGMVGKSGARALVDSTGVGDPIVEQLQARCPGLVEGFKFTAQSKQQIMEGLAAAIQQRALTIPDGPLVAELESYGYEYTKSGVRYTAPDGLHDDGVCALALAQHARAKPRARFLVA